MFLRDKKKSKHSSVFATPKTDLPEKPRPKVRKKINFKPWLWGGFFVLFLAGTVYLFIFSSVFKIKEINVTGNNLIASEDIKNIAQDFLRGKILRVIPHDTIFALTGRGIQENVLRAYPEAAEVQVKKTKIDELSVSVSERKTAAILCRAASAPSPSPSLIPESASSTVVKNIKETLPEADQCFFTDADGFVYREAPQISGTILPTFYALNPDVAQLKNKAMELFIVQFATQVKKELREAEVDLTGFVLDDGGLRELKSFTSEGWLIYFDPARPALTQAKVLEALLSEEIKKNRASLEYVDLRVENRVYYK